MPSSDAWHLVMKQLCKDIYSTSCIVNEIIFLMNQLINESSVSGTAHPLLKSL